MRIAMVASRDGANARYRVFGPAEALRARGHRVLSTVFDDLRDPSALLGYDVVCGWRIASPRFTRVARSLADAGVGFVWDNDDNLAALDVKGRSDHRLVSSLRGHKILSEMSRLMRLADVVTTPSTDLAAHYRETTGAHVRVVENYVAPITPRVTPAKPDALVVGWVAHVEHQTDISGCGCASRCNACSTAISTSTSSRSAAASDSTARGTTMSPGCGSSDSTDS